MSLSCTRPLAAAVLLTVLVTGCGADNPAADAAAGSPSAGKAAGSGPTTATAPSTAPSTTPSSAASPSPATSPAGIERLPARTILARARAAAKAAPSVRLQGSFTENGERLGLDIDSAGNGMSGTFTTPVGKIELIGIGRTVYMKPSEQFFRSQARSKAEGDAMVTMLGGRWIMTTRPDADTRELLELADPAKVFQDLLQPEGKLRKVGPRTVGGVKCVGLSDGAGVLWVDAVSARPVRMESTGKKPDVLTFSRYGQVRAPKAPPKSKTIDEKVFDS